MYEHIITNKTLADCIITNQKDRDVLGPLLSVVETIGEATTMAKHYHRLCILLDKEEELDVEVYEVLDWCKSEIKRLATICEQNDIPIINI